ncbi:hypothetical protein CPV46_20260 [Salmonella enterica]|nr:hypothetical protein [Salmonella enterica]ECA4572121.1 hypothetical protein [Salmonella enterica subsp. enterica serovar Muenchen]EAP7083180.1 hypothetical protein [Salmonella enterica]EBI3913525.1 hypothetical protein [Salmonella enterica]EBK3459589.1 hypothetical protein [Salmonella enterica]
MTYINQEDKGNLDYSSFSAAYVGSLLSPVPYSWAMEKTIFQQNEIPETSAMCNDDGKLWTEDVWIVHVCRMKDRILSSILFLENFLRMPA